MLALQQPSRVTARAQQPHFLPWLQLAAAQSGRTVYLTDSAEVTVFLTRTATSQSPPDNLSQGTTEWYDFPMLYQVLYCIPQSTEPGCGENPP